MSIKPGLIGRCSRYVTERVTRVLASLAAIVPSAAVPPRAKFLSLVLACACMCLHSGVAYGKMEPAKTAVSLTTNLEMLESLVRDAVDSSLVKAPLEPDDVIHIEGIGGHPLGWIVENYLSARLAAQVAAVYVVETRWGAPAGKSGEGKGRQGRSVIKPAGEAVSQDMDFEAKRAAVESELKEGRNPGSTPGEGGQGEASQDSLSRGEFPLETGPEVSEASAAGKQNEAGGIQSNPDTTQAEGTSTQTAAEAQQGGAEVSAAAPLKLQTVQEPPQTGKILEFRVGELEIDYPRKWRSSLLGSPMVERSARVVVFFRLMDKLDGRVLWADSGRAAGTDIVSQKSLVGLEVDEEVGGAASALETGGLGRVVEPIVVSGIVVGLVFLFYSSRT